MGHADLGRINGQHGIIPRAVWDIFTRSCAHAKEVSTTIILSYMEIYNDHLFDLLQPFKKHLLTTKGAKDIRQHKAGLNVKEAGEGQIYVPHLMAVKVTALEQVFSLIKHGNDQRSMRQTELNQNSSRSHSILQFLLEQRPKDGSATVTRSKVNFVDLAGSERYPADNSSKNRVSEMTAINVSLSALASVVSTLVSKEKHIPYRNSKLTHLLKDSLGGNCNTYVIATVSPSARSFDENVSTLKFADRAAAITNNPLKNVQLDLKSLLELKDREIERLRAMLETFAEKHKSGQEEDASQSTSRVSTSDDELRELKTQVEALQDALNVERQRALELENQMRGGEVIDAPDLLDVDSLRRDSSLCSAGTSGRGTKDAAGLQTTSCRTSRQHTSHLPAKKHSSAPDNAQPEVAPLSVLNLSTSTSSVSTSTVRSVALHNNTSLSMYNLKSSPAFPTSGKRRPKGRSRRPTTPLPHEPNPTNPSSRGPQRAAQCTDSLTSKKQVGTNSSKNTHYRTLVEMYSKLAKDVADMNANIGHGSRHWTSQVGSNGVELSCDANLVDMASRTSATSSLQSEMRGWGLRNIVSRQTFPSYESAFASDVSGVGRSCASAQGARGFGLKSILQPKPAVTNSFMDQQRVESFKTSSTTQLAPSRSPDVFGAGSWIYIMGTSTSSVKAKQIAASTKHNPRLAQLALKSIDLNTRQKS